MTKYITKKEVYVKLRLGQKTAKTQKISTSGILDEKITIPYENEDILECEIMVPPRSRVGISQISLRQVPLQQNAQPHGFRVLNSTRKQIATLGMTLFKTNRQEIAAQGTNILNATIGSNTRRASATGRGGILSSFTANPIAGQQVGGRVGGNGNPVQPQAALTAAPQRSNVYPAEKYAELRSIIGSISDEKANELLGNFNGNVESAVNYFYATQQESVSQVYQPPPPSLAPSAPTLLPASNNSINSSENHAGTQRRRNSNSSVNPHNMVQTARRNSVNSRAAVRQRALSVQKFPDALHKQLRDIIGDVSDRKADELLDKAGGNIERAVNFYFANPGSTVAPAATVVATTAHPATSTTQNVVVQPTQNTSTNSISATPVVRGTYINYNSAGNNRNHANVVMQPQPVVVTSAPVSARSRNVYNPSMGATLGQHAYGNYGSKCALPFK